MIARALRVLVLALALLPLLAAPGEASIGLAVAPSELDLGVQSPGLEIARSLTLRSTRDAAIVVRPELKDYTDTGNGRLDLLPPGTARGSAANWVRVAPTTQTLAAGELGRIDVRVLVPADAEAGGHYAMLVLRYQAAEPPGAGQFAPRGAINVPVRVTVTGQLQAVGTVVSVGSVATHTPGRAPADPLDRVLPIDISSVFGLPAVHVPGPVLFSSQLTSDGNVHLTAKARTTVKDLLGNEVAVIDSGPFTALPHSRVVIGSIWEDPPALGVFTAFMQIDDGTDPPHDFQQYTFIIAPWKSGLLSLFSLGVLLALARWGMRRAGVRAPRPRLRLPRRAR